MKITRIDADRKKAIECTRVNLLVSGKSYVLTEHDGMLEVHGVDGPLVVLPSVSNEIHIDTNLNY
ncbi:MAG: hypothetical protein GY928_40050 [Colwellia sp.]|nr:hypothetical protein [Colwellia sp.]